MHTTSVSLIERLRHLAEEEAWGRLVELYTPLLYFWANRMGLQEQDAGDLVQDVFAVLVQKLPEFVYDPDKSFRGWLRTILYNKCRDRIRRKAALPTAHDSKILAALSDEQDPFWEADIGSTLSAGPWR